MTAPVYVDYCTCEEPERELGLALCQRCLRTIRTKPDRRSLHDRGSDGRYVAKEKSDPR